jgi:hypothetical protein
MRVIPVPKVASDHAKNYCKLNEISNTTGSVELKMDPSIRKMARELTKLLKTVKPLEEQASNICRDMSQLQNQMNENFVKLSTITSEINKVYQAASSRFDFDHFSKIADIYKDLNTTFIDWGAVQRSSTCNWFQNIRMIFSFSSQEEEGLENVPFSIQIHFLNFLACEIEKPVL